MANKTFEKHIRSLKGFVDGSRALPKMPHTFIENGEKVERVRTKKDFADELGKIRADIEKHAAAGKIGAINRLKLFDSILGIKDKNKKSN